MDRTGLSFEVVIVRNNDSTFTGRDQLARLETEGCRCPERADFLLPPLTTVCMRGILDKMNATVGGNRAQTIQIGRMSTHVDCDDRLRFRCDCGFYLGGIDAMSLRIDIDHYR